MKASFSKIASSVVALGFVCGSVMARTEPDGSTPEKEAVLLAEAPAGWTPYCFDCVYQYPSPSTAVYGIRLGVVGENRSMTGLSIGLLRNFDQEAYWCMRTGFMNDSDSEQYAFDVAGLVNRIRGKRDKPVIGSGFQVAGGGNYDPFCDYSGAMISGWVNVSSELIGMQVSGIMNRAKSVKGFQAVGLANVAKDGLSGLQVAGLGNYCGGSCFGAQVGLADYSEDLFGAQCSGLLNIAAEVNGFQAAGLGNVAVDVVGLQTAGFINFCLDFCDGAQIGMGNACLETCNGAQIGLANVCLGRAHGAQIGFVNYCEELSGVQIGLVNRSEKGTGVQIGFVNSIGEGIPLPLLNVRF